MEHFLMSWRQSLPSFPETYTSSRSFYYQRTIDHGRLGACTAPLFRCDQVQCWSNSSHLVWELLIWLPFYMKPTQNSWEWRFSLGRGQRSYDWSGTESHGGVIRTSPPFPFLLLAATQTTCQTTLIGRRVGTYRLRVIPWIIRTTVQPHRQLNGYPR